LAGAHFFASWTDPVDNRNYKPYVAWIGNGSLDAMTVALSHELVEAITDPQGNGIQVAPANPTNWNEIGDVCASVAYLDGIAVQSYWSQQAGSCVIPISQFDWIEQRPPAGVALRAIAIRLNYSRELRRYWIGYVRTTDPATGQVYDLLRAQAANLIEQGVNSIYVIGADGSRANVEVDHTADGHAFLRTTPDDTTADNLLALPHFV
jgi:hypothetical protein